MGVGLHCLLEGAHFLYFQKLSAPLLVNSPSLLPFYFQFLSQTLLLLFKSIDFFLKLLDLLVRLLVLLTLETIDCFQEAVRVFDFVLD